jgi:hypothetical protein
VLQLLLQFLDSETDASRELEAHLTRAVDSRRQPKGAGTQKHQPISVHIGVCPGLSTWLLVENPVWPGLSTASLVNHPNNQDNNAHIHASYFSAINSAMLGPICTASCTILGRSRHRNRARTITLSRAGQCEMLNAEERRIWSDAVAAYAGTLSTLSTLQMPMPPIAIVLGDAKDAPSLAGVKIDPAARTVLEGAAPIYRKTWWKPHREQHQRFLISLQAMIDRHGQGVHDFLTGRYGIAWPTAGYPVHFVAYASAQGNYSIVGPSGPFLVMSTNPNPANAGLCPSRQSFTKGCISGIARSPRRSARRRQASRFRRISRTL